MSSSTEARPDSTAAAAAAAAACCSWVVPETGESFGDYDGYVRRLVALRQPQADLVLTACGTVTYPGTTEPVLARPDVADGVETIDISPDDALRRLAGCEFHAVGLDSAERVHRLRIEVDALLAQADDEGGLGADLVADLRRIRAGVRHLAEPRSGPLPGRTDAAAVPEAESVLRLHERVAKLEAALQASTLTQAESVLDELEGRVALLSEARLDQIAAKSKQAVVEMRILSQEASANVDRRAFDDLRDAVARWDDVAGALPHVVRRLMAIKDLHEHGANVMSRVAAAEQTVQAAGEQLRQCGAAVRNMERTLAENLQIMEANCAALAERLDRLERNK